MTATTTDTPTDTDQPPRGEKLRILVGFARPHKNTLLLGLALSLVATAMGLATPMVTKWVLDSLSEGLSLATPIALLIGLLVVGSAVGLTQWILMGTVAERIVLDARESLVRKFLRATVPAVTRRPVGELVTRTTSDTLLLREAASSSLVSLVNGVVA